MSDQRFTIVPAWRTTFLACLVVFVAMILLFYPTAEGMVLIWYNFDTYTHGFVILPISLWLIWEKRAHLAAFTPQPQAGFLVLLAGCLGIWALARLTGVQIVEQWAFIASLVSALAAILGWQVSRFLAFPLLFLFFAVPMGEDLVPPMMDFTAVFTVEALKLTGIPVYRDGLWFSLPTGNWSVVEACSGVRYLIASVTLGVMYAYITYHTLWKRLLFILLSALVPILANGMRAYIIVMIGHLSEMEYATGVDHLIYGWLFFGIVMFILFWIGSRWQEEHAPPEFVAPPREMSDRSVGIRVSLISLVALLAAASTIWATQRAETIETELVASLTPPQQVGDWSLDPTPLDWSVAHQPTPHKIEARYAKGGDQVQLHVILFPQQRQGSEAINQRNRIAETVVRHNRLGRPILNTGARPHEVNSFKAVIGVDGLPRELVVWQWYRVAGRSLVNRYEGKVWEAWSRIFPGRADGAWIAVTTSLGRDDVGVAEKRLSDFASSLAPLLEQRIDSVLESGN